MRTLFLLSYLSLFITSCSSTQAASSSVAPISTVSPNIMTQLSELKPLPKVHYSWGLNSVLLDVYESRLLYELARITHSLSVQSMNVTQKQIDNCVYTCARVNKTKPKISCSIGINFSPWHYRFGKKLPPTDRGPTYYSEIAYFNETMQNIKSWIAKANKKYGNDVKVGAVLLDSERFYQKAGDTAWNESIRECLDTIHIRTKSVFPDARVEWYGRGVGVADGSDGWMKSRVWTGKEIRPTLSCSLYTLPEIERTRETFRRTCELADELGVKEVTPWLALASGYRRDMEKFQRWTYSWDYDIIYSYMTGAEINHKWYGDRPKWFAPYNRAKVVIFYPDPFYKDTPFWGKHFMAYVRGATGVKKLDDLK